MRQFESIDPENIENDPRVVSQILDSEDPERTYSLLIDGDYALMAKCSTAGFACSCRPFAGREWIFRTSQSS